MLTGGCGGIGKLYGTWQSCRLNNRIKAKQFGNMLGANPNHPPFILTHHNGKSNAKHSIAEMKYASDFKQSKISLKPCIKSTTVRHNCC